MTPDQHLVVIKSVVNGMKESPLLVSKLVRGQLLLLGHLCPAIDNKYEESAQKRDTLKPLVLNDRNSK